MNYSWQAHLNHASILSYVGETTDAVRVEINATVSDDDSDIDIDIDVISNNSQPSDSLDEEDDDAKAESMLEPRKMRNPHNRDCVRYPTMISIDPNTTVGDVDFTSKDVIDHILNKWLHKTGYNEFLDEPTDMQAGDEATKIAEKLFAQSFGNLSDADKTAYAILFRDHLACDSAICASMSRGVYMLLLENALQLPEVQQHRQDYIDKINVWCSKAQVKPGFNTTPTVAKKKQRIGVPNDHPYYPLGCMFWIEAICMYLRKMLPTSALEWLIDNANDSTRDGIETPQFTPSSIPELHWIWASCVGTTDIEQITAKIKTQASSDHDAVVSEYTREIGYDSILTDMRAMFETPIEREGLIAHKSKYEDIMGQNPQHLAPGVPRTSIHLTDTLVSKHVFWRFIERVAWILDLDYDGALANTKLVTPGTFLVNHEKREFILVTDVINGAWNYHFMPRPGESKEQWRARLLIWAVSLVDDVNKIKNDMLHPICDIEYIQFHWEFEECESASCDHFAVDTERIVWLDWPLGLAWKDLLKTRQLVDGWHVCTLNVGSDWQFKDPLLGRNELPPADTIWHWFGVQRDSFTQPIRDLPALKFNLMCLYDPFRAIQPGLSADPEASTAMYLYNEFSDAFTLLKGENGMIGNSSVLASYHAPVQHLYDFNRLYLHAVAWDGDSNRMLWHKWQYDVVKAVFHGISVQCRSQQQDNMIYRKHIYGCPLFICVDNKEAAHMSATRAHHADRSDIRTTLSIHGTMSDYLRQPERHLKVLCYQRVCLKVCLFV